MSHSELYIPCCNCGRGGNHLVYDRCVLCQKVVCDACAKVAYFRYCLACRANVTASHVDKPCRSWWRCSRCGKREARRTLHDNAGLSASDSESGEAPGYQNSAAAWQNIGPDTPRDRQLLMRFDTGGDIWEVRWSEEKRGWYDGDATEFRPSYTHAQWCEVPTR